MKRVATALADHLADVPALIFVCVARDEETGLELDRVLDALGARSAYRPRSTPHSSARSSSPPGAGFG